MWNQTSLAGKRVLVTAGGDGIGLEITRAFIEAGAEVLVCDIRPESNRSRKDGVSAQLALSRHFLNEAHSFRRIEFDHPQVGIAFAPPTNRDP